MFQNIISVIRRKTLVMGSFSKLGDFTPAALRKHTSQRLFSWGSYEISQNIHVHFYLSEKNPPEEFNKKMF